ncbi:Asp-tRNA(Asn)/Glu-tRNA(Gln) amidotransferase subunit GatA [Oceanicoccus sp. KOV_DT_Chl]|uniref:Asp-tRNA(Asn)/Glu-tRNA(Gln) amidotransferase subunit GatA n=1 Tax=Oceanicoccus sp. KOV_DT_Chl TaxID=1904639 RepID=UPI000C79A379|nr:Asp-tRNA(Asn)/Glu-tRNA(Gln) amidotransferase subunit GatA [Oceanicoccus sp. KOV_DT_Chl]
MHNKTLAELSNGLANKEFSSVELTQHFLNRIEKMDGSYNSFITVTPELALTQAKAADSKRANGEAEALTGVPLAHKDIFCTAGVKTSCGSKMLDNFIPPYNATVIEKFNQAGTVSLGKTNMDEFAMGSSNESSFYGAVKNPWDAECVPGGSSGGSAAAVAALLAPAATGTDTGGSIRQPAALCGISGIKPTYGRVSRYGMIAFASSLDQGGPMTRSAEDAALMLNVMAGFDEKDSTCIDQPVPDYTATLNDDLSGLTIGLPKEYFGDGLNPAIEQAIQAAIKEYEALGATVKEISLPNTHLAVPCYYIIAPSEASANLSRFDGVRYGYRCKDPKDLHDLYTRTREEGFGEEVKRRILIGTYALSAGFYDAYYRKAQQIRRLIKNDFVTAFNDVDIIMGPTVPNTAFKLGEKSNDPVSMYLEDIYTISTNLAGLPGMSIPAGLVEGKPAGLQLTGNYFAEAKMLNVAHKFQQATDWHQQQPVNIQVEG